MTIHAAQNAVLVCEPLKPNKVIVENILRSHTIMEDKLEEIETKGITKQQILNLVQMSELELDLVLKELLPLQIGDKLYRLEEGFLMNTGGKLIMAHCNSDLRTRQLFTLNSLIEAETTKQTVPEELLEGHGLAILSNVLSQIFDLKSEDSEVGEHVFERNVYKFSTFYARYMFHENGPYCLSNFITELNNYLDVLLDEESGKQVEARNQTVDSKSNLIEGLTGIDLGYLKRYAFITFKEHYHEKDHMISPIDYYSLGDNLKDRLQSLYQLKKKWTKGELQTFLGEFLDDYKNDINQLLSKEMKFLKEKNPLDSEKEIFYYLKKF